MLRPEQPDPFVRGCAFQDSDDVWYPRADPLDAPRLPVDTWTTAQLPVTVRLEMVGDAEAVDVAYTTETDDLGYRGPGAGTTFSLWRGGALVDEQPAVLGDGRVRLSMGEHPPDTAAVVYLPEGMKPRIMSVEAVGGSIERAPRGPRWLAYGDSIAEGWVASSPARAWPAIVGRERGIDVVNLGYAGAARGEMASAEQISRIPADVISISHGTNCWMRTPHSDAQMLANTEAFIDVIRQGHPDVPIVVMTPVLRPDAERTPNRFGTDLRDIRASITAVVTERIDEYEDDRMWLVDGLPLLRPEHLPDGIHPGDEGHEILAAAFGDAVVEALGPGYAVR